MNAQSAETATTIEPAIDAAAHVMRSARERYEVLATLGEGSSAIVFKVRDLELDDVVALKVLSPKVAGDPRVVDRLKNEIKLARRVRHPNVARVFDLEEWDGRLCVSMEFIDGATLATRLLDKPMHWSEVVPILSTLALALESAHAQGVVHRDLKPANIILDRLGNPYILDFGIAIGPGRHSSASPVVRGTPAYLAPERWAGVQGIPASDLYSLGVIGFEMLAGHRPFQSQNLRVLVAQHMAAPVPDLGELLPGVPADLTVLVRQLLAKPPEARPASSGEVVRRLRLLLPAKRNRGRDAGQTPRGKVMVVDDEDAVRSILAEVLRRRGVEVCDAADGPSALRLAVAERPDLVFLDISMPGLDGVATLKLLRARPEMAGRHVVMLSGSSDPTHPEISRELGAVAFLSKPINPDVLDLVLDKYLG